MNATLRIALALASSLTFACAAPVDTNGEESTGTEQVAQDATNARAVVDAPSSVQTGDQVEAPTLQTSTHDNRFHVVSYNDSNMNRIKYIGFQYDNAFSITPGQPWDGLTVTESAGDGKWAPDPEVHVTAGRKGSNVPKDWFNARNGGAKISTESSWHNIQSMNFAFSGYIVINDDRYLVVIGQEGGTTDNGWWLAGQGSGWKFHSPVVGEDYLTTPDGKYEFVGWDYSSYTMRVRIATSL